MNLIDADKLIEEINNLGWRLYDTLTLKGLSIALETIKEQPTAFDVDKVVKGLEELRESEDVDGRAYYTMSEKEAINKAIKIVKRGGIDESI